jgi:hypothetical protein
MCGENAKKTMPLTRANVPEGEPYDVPVLKT